MNNKIIKETENHTLYQTTSGDIYIGNSEGEVALIISSYDPVHEAVLKNAVGSYTDNDMGGLFDDNWDDNRDED